MTQLKELTVFVSETGRRYIDAADIAVICGIDGHSLDRLFRPDSWATPRDFKWDGRRMWFAEASLGQLADSLNAGGQPDAAILLRDWLVKHVVAVAESAATDAELVAPIPRDELIRRARFLSHDLHSWTRKWEDEHQ